MENIKQIYIGNILEAFYKSYIKLPPVQRKLWTKYDSLENNRSLLYGDDNKIVITPTPIEGSHFEYIKKLLNFSNVYNLYPKKHTNSICENIKKDNILYQKFISVVKNNPKIQIIAYRNTPHFYKFIDFLKKQNLDFETPEILDDNNKFIEKYFHSKSGFRHLWEQVKDPALPIEIPFGFITSDKNEAIEAAYFFKQKDKNFVIKYNHGVQGIGVVMFEAAKLPSGIDKFKKEVELYLKGKIWLEGCIVVEERANIDKNVLGGSPDVEFRIAQNGDVIKEYACEQILDGDGKTFLGVGMNKEVDSSPYIQAAQQASFLFGSKLSDLGYRGYYDMDLVVTKEQKVFAVESNLRRTGGTHIHDLCKVLLGNDYSSNFYVVSYEIKFKNKTLTYQKLLDKYKEILYDKNSKIGVIIYNPDMLTVGVIQLMCIALNREDLNNLVSKTKSLI